MSDEDLNPEKVYTSDVLKSAKKEKRKPLLLKVTQEEKKIFQALAKKYTGGNVSKWIRYAAANHKPRKSELE